MSALNKKFFKQFQLLVFWFSPIQIIQTMSFPLESWQIYKLSPTTINPNTAYFSSFDWLVKFLPSGIYNDPTLAYFILQTYSVYKSFVSSIYAMRWDAAEHGQNVLCSTCADRKANIEALIWSATHYHKNPSPSNASERNQSPKINKKSWFSCNVFVYSR